MIRTEWHCAHVLEGGRELAYALCSVTPIPWADRPPSQLMHARTYALCQACATAAQAALEAAPVRAELAREGAP